MSITRQEVYEGISNASHVSEVFDWIDKAFAGGHEPELDRDVLLDCCAYGINRMAELTVDVPDIAQEIIPARVLDLCIEDSDDDAKRYHYSEFRKSVVRWMEQYNEITMCNIRLALLSQVIHRLKINPNQDLVWMIAAIGYRDGEISSILKGLVFNEDIAPATRYAALSTLCSLGGLTEEDKEQFRCLAETHLKHTTAIPLFSVLRWLRSPQSVDFLLDALCNSSAEQQETFFPDFCIGALSEIAEAHPKFSKQIWDVIVRIVIMNKETDRRPHVGELIFNGNLLNRFNLKDVPEQLLKFLIERPEMDEQSKHVRYLFYLRLTELTGSNQLTGLCPDQSFDVQRLLKADCVQNTNNQTRSMSSDDMLKESAWDVALRIGLEESLDWFSAVFDEASPFMRGRILKLLACFSRPSLPDILGTWLTKRLNWSGNDLPEIFYIEPAIKMAAYSSDPSAFEWLLDFGMTYRGNVPTNAVDGLAIYCLERISRTEDSYGVARELVSQLIESFKTDWKGKTDLVRQRRVLAAVALEEIASSHQLIETEQQKIITIFNELDFVEDVFALCPLARIIITASPSDQTIMRIEKLAIHDNQWVAAHGIYALDLAGKSASSNCVLQKQGIVFSDENWTVAEPAKLSEQGAYLLGRFYLSNQVAAKDAVIAVIERGDWRTVSRLIATLGGKSSNSDSNNEVANAIVSRIFTRVSYAYSENSLFKGLAYFSPGVFLSIVWNKHWNSWSSESLIAMIQAIRESTQSADANSQSLAIALLSELELAPAQEVRQEARLAWSRIDRDSFEKSVDSRVSNNLELSSVERRLAAEACWAIQDENIFIKVSSSLKDDPDRRVREACVESMKMREERVKARENLEKVISSLTNDSLMLAAWKFGEALVVLGESDHLDELLCVRSELKIPPNRKYWLSQLAEKLEKKIKEKKRKNIQDWSPTGSQVVRSEGVVKANGVEKNAIFVIRKWVSEGLDECQRWEGDGWLTEESTYLPMSISNIEIKLNNGDSGTALISSSNLKSFSFSGMQFNEQNHHGE